MSPIGTVFFNASLAAMKGMTWESPRGPMSIDPQTRDVVNNRFRKSNGHSWHRTDVRYRLL